MQAASITQLLENIDRDIEAEVIQPTEPTTENRDYSLSMIRMGSDERVTVTFVEQEGYLILRVTIKGESTDLLLNSDQIKLLLRQAALWLTR
jgi:hypothetical protein